MLNSQSSPLRFDEGGQCSVMRSMCSSLSSQAKKCESANMTM